MRRRLGGVAALCAAVTLLAACGGSDGDDNGGSAASGGGAGALDRSLKIGILFEIPGESQVAVADYANIAELAVKDLNDNGGVGGHPVEMRRLPVSALDPQKATSQFLEMVDWEPDVIIGFPSGTIGAVVPQIERAGIPVITPVIDKNTLLGSQTGSEWLWILPPLVTSLPGQAARFATEELKPTRIAQIHTNETYGLNSSAAFEAALKELGGTIDSSQQIAPTATDLTPQVLAMGDADFLAAWIFPNTLGLLDRQLQQNGRSPAVISTGSAELAFGFGTLVAGETAGDYYASIGCNTGAAEPGSELEQVVTSYQQAYPDAAVPFSQAVNVWDGIHLAASAAEQAGSLDHEQVNSAIGSLRYEGACGVYEADGAHVLGHEVNIVHFTPDGPQTVATYQNPPLSSGDDA